MTAAEVVARQGEYGLNRFEEEKPTPLWKKILHHLSDVSIIILLIAVALSAAMAITNPDADWIKPAVISFIVVLNVTLGITQEASAEKALASLAQLSSPTAKVIRDGEQAEIDAVEVVPGDIIVLETGDLVPADARLVESADLAVDEASLTGESEPSEKVLHPDFGEDVPLGDQKNMVFSSCLVTAGRARAVVVGTGMQTEIGKIAGYLNNTQKLKTPLQIRLDKIGKAIALVAVVAALLLLLVGIQRGTDTWDLIFLAIALAVAAVPEMLALIVTLTLSHGVKNMVKKNALIRKLPAVETLGSTSVICSDKTGTLTQNRMTIKRLWLGEGQPFAEDIEFDKPARVAIKQFALASNALVKLDGEGAAEFVGNPTENAINRLCFAKGYDKQASERKYPRIAEVPFSSERKMMTTVHRHPDGGYLVLTKGAFDRLPFAEVSKKEAKERLRVHDELADQALRILALGRRRVKKLPENLEELERDLEFVGIIGLIDPPRPEVKPAIERARKAGIRTVMITGDHAATAKAIALDLGILGEGGRVVTGPELSRMSDQELIEDVQDIAVYARVSPEDKLRIVEAWQEHEEVVAMTGDGVNDAPALKAADVGVAMGITGTEVSKSASDMILIDDNFATIVDAVQEGRNVFAIIKKLVYFLITCNFAEVMIIIGAFWMGWGANGAIITPVLILLINVLADGVPGLRLPYESAGPSIMKRKPIGRNESVFGGGLMFVIAKQVMAFVSATWAAYLIAAYLHVDGGVGPSYRVGMSVAFLTLTFCAVLHIFTARTKRSIFSKGFRDNWQLAVAALAMLVLTSSFVLLRPFQVLFDLEPIGAMHWPIIIGLGLVPTVVAEISKAITKWRDRREGRGRLVRHEWVHAKDDNVEYSH
ncbi:MAG: cation-translocating P-type ATPase [Promicromonosporaceae bacterium]|nr:cation-translocating P-type ATPase [Promicromonosporaceae bacterium]